MKILVISNYYPPLEIGGWEQLTRDVSQGLAARGHQIFVLTSSYRRDEAPADETGVWRQLHLQSPDHVHYHPRYSLLRKRWEEENRAILRQIVVTYEPDIIFINGMWNTPRSLAVEAERLMGNQVVYYMASYWPTETDAHTSYWQSEADRPWLRGPKQLVGAMLGAGAHSTAAMKPSFPHVLCVSAFLQEYMVRDVEVPTEQTRVVHNGIEPDLFTMRTPDPDATPVRLLYAGRLSPDKGVHTVVEALAGIRAQKPDFPATLSIVGGGAPAYEARLQRLIEQRQLADVARLWGKVPREEMPQILGDHHVLLAPSIWPEPLARMTQEGMAAGLVVISTPTGGTPELVRHDENGLLAAPDHVDALAVQMQRVVEDGALRTRLSLAARQTIEQHFTMPRMVNEIEDYFHAILATGQEQSRVETEYSAIDR